MENEKQIEEQFASLPLNEKVASLFKMELATLSEAFSVVSREPMKVVEKVGDLITEFGTRIEAEFKAARKGQDEQTSTKQKRSGKKTDGPSNSSKDPASV